jgi:hypothetical protein
VLSIFLYNIYTSLTLDHRRGRRCSSETPTFYQNDLAKRNTADETGGKPIAVRLQSISGGDVANPLFAFYDIHERERCYSFVLSRTPHETLLFFIIIISLSQSTAGHRPLQYPAIARSSATRIQLLPAVLRKSSLPLA